MLRNSESSNIEIQGNPSCAIQSFFSPTYITIEYYHLASLIIIYPLALKRGNWKFPIEFNKFTSYKTPPLLLTQVDESPLKSN